MYYTQHSMEWEIKAFFSHQIQLSGNESGIQIVCENLYMMCIHTHRYVYIIYTYIVLGSLSGSWMSQFMVYKNNIIIVSRRAKKRQRTSRRRGEKKILFPQFIYLRRDGYFWFYFYEFLYLVSTCST